MLPDDLWQDVPFLRKKRVVEIQAEIFSTIRQRLIEVDLFKFSSHLVGEELRIQESTGRNS